MVVGPAQTDGGIGVQRLAGRDEVDGGCESDDSRQPDCATPAWKHSQVDFGATDRGRVVGGRGSGGIRNHAAVAPTRQLRATAQASARHGGDGGKGERGESSEQRVNSLACRLNLPAVGRGYATGQLEDVGSGEKTAGLSRANDEPGKTDVVRAGRQRVERLGERVEHFAGQHVHAADRVVKRQDSDIVCRKFQSDGG